MKSTENQKGITLIALIITIIVMLILVAVTINVALNGGLFQRAKNAKSDTQIQADNEELLSAVTFAYDEIEGTIDVAKLRNELRTGWQVTGNGPYTCTSPNNNVFTLDTHGKITVKQDNGQGGTSTVPDILRKYMLGENEQGLDLFVESNEENGIISIFTGQFVDNTTIDNASTIIHYIDILEGENSIDLYFKYDVDENCYKTTAELKNNSIITTNVIKVYDINEDSPNVGKTLTYNGKSYTVITDNGTELELLANYLSDEPLSIGANTYSDALSEYNNAITTLNNACIAVTGLTVDGTNVKSIRCIGSSGKSEVTSTYPNPDSTTYPVYEGNAKNKDINHIDDCIKMFATNSADAEEKYWLASRDISADGSIDFWVREINNYHYPHVDRTSIFHISESNTTTGNIRTLYLRPVVTISSNAEGIVWDNN